MNKALIYGILSSIFFAATFVLNSSMNLSGGNWMWSAALRYLFMFVILFVILWRQKRVKRIFSIIKENPLQWFLWSTIGFGLFYLPLTFASNFGESWLVAGCWQLTIIAGILLTPLFGKPIPRKSLMLSGIIVIGVGFIQLEHATTIGPKQLLLSILPIVIAAFSYPLGNRKMMLLCGGKISTLERVFGMTLCSLPFWFIVSAIAYSNSGLPSNSQFIQSLIVAVFSGVIATILFFQATELVKHHPGQLALVEATQAGEVIFSIIGEVFLLGGSLPGTMGLIGLILIISGMMIGSFVGQKA